MGLIPLPLFPPSPSLPSVLFPEGRALWRGDFVTSPSPPLLVGSQATTGFTSSVLSPLMIPSLTYGGHRRPLGQHSCDNDPCRSHLKDRLIEVTAAIGSSFTVIPILITASG